MSCRLRRIGDRQARFKLLSYLDFRVCFACFPPESFKIIFLTCIWLKFVDTSFHSSQKKSQTHRRSPRHFLRFKKKNVAWSSKIPGAGTRHILITLFSNEWMISVKLFKVVANAGNPPLCSGVIAVPNGPKSHTFTVILAVVALQPRWRHKPWKGLYSVILCCVSLRLPPDIRWSWIHTRNIWRSE